MQTFPAAHMLFADQWGADPSDPNRHRCRAQREKGQASCVELTHCHVQQARLGIHGGGTKENNKPNMSDSHPFLEAFLKHYSFSPAQLLVNGG